MSELVVLVGAGPGLGQAIGQAFAEQGSRVLLIARSERRLRGVAAAVGADHLAVDVTDTLALRSAFERIRATYGDPTVLVHNPSLAFEAPATKTPLEALMGGLHLAAGSLLVAAQEVAPAMREMGRGTILVTGNAVATKGSTWSAALAAQKAAARSLTLSLAAELGPSGIRVATITINGILGTPGFEPRRIAQVYVDLATVPADTQWAPEVHWPEQSGSR